MQLYLSFWCGSSRLCHAFWEWSFHLPHLEVWAITQNFTVYTMLFKLCLGVLTLGLSRFCLRVLLSWSVDRPYGVWVEDPNADTGEQNLNVNKKRAFIELKHEKQKYNARYPWGKTKYLTKQWPDCETTKNPVTVLGDPVFLCFILFWSAPVCI